MHQSQCYSNHQHLTTFLIGLLSTFPRPGTGAYVPSTADAHTCRSVKEAFERISSACLQVSKA